MSRPASSCSRRWPMPEIASRPVPAPTATREGALRGAGIASVAMCVPDRSVPNAEIAERIGVDGNWIAKRTGIRERRIAWPEERLSAFAAEAGVMALERAGLAASELDLVLVAT